MASLEHQHYVIMGGPRDKPTRGLVSTLAEINSEYTSGRLTLPRFKEKAAIALGGWVSAMPTYRFELCKVPKRRDFANYIDYDRAIDALYQA
jgi:hypothetical protein